MTEKGRIYEDYFLESSWLKYRYGVWSAPTRLLLWLHWLRLDAVTVNIEPKPDMVTFRLARKNLTTREIARIWEEAPYRKGEESDVA